MRNMSTMKKLAGICGLLVLTLAVGAWDDSYLARRDSISPHFGEANAANKATQTIDPWPAHAKNSTINLDGQRARTNQQRYEQGKVLQPRGLNTTTVTESAGPGAHAETAIQK
jgi:hypothetical protein